MTETLIIEKAIGEIYLKEFGATKQLLEIHEVVYENDKPKVLRIDRESNDGSVIVYFPIKGQKFYLALWLDIEPQISVRHVNTEYYNSVCLKVTSNHCSFQGLSAFTKLKATSGWSKGDIRKTEKSVHNSTALYFEPNPEPDEFTDKLKKLLDFLDQDREGVAKLVEKAYAQIQVVTIFHNGNTMLGGHHLDLLTIKRIAAFNLEIDFDLYAEGNFYKG